MTTLGTRARLWTYFRGLDYLDPLFGSTDISAKKEYIEAHSTQAAQLTAGFNIMKDKPPSSLLQAYNISQTNKPLAGSSFTPTVENEVNLKQLIDNNGKTYYSWAMPDGSKRTEWTTSSKWTLVVETLVHKIALASIRISAKNYTTLPVWPYIGTRDHFCVGERKATSA